MVVNGYQLFEDTQKKGKYFYVVITSSIEMIIRWICRDKPTIFCVTKKNDPPKKSHSIISRA